MSLDTSIESIEKHATFMSPVFPKQMYFGDELQKTPPRPLSVYPVRLTIVAKRPGVERLMVSEYAGTAVEQGSDVPLSDEKRSELIANLSKLVTEHVRPGQLFGRVGAEFNRDEPQEWHDVEWVRFYEKGDSV